MAQQVPGIGMSGAILPLHSYAFMAGTGTIGPVKHNKFTQNMGLCIRQYQYTRMEMKPL